MYHVERSKINQPTYKGKHNLTFFSLKVIKKSYAIE